jgi:hypothetical protein
VNVWIIHNLFRSLVTTLLYNLHLSFSVLYYGDELGIIDFGEIEGKVAVSSLMVFIALCLIIKHCSMKTYDASTVTKAKLLKT